MAPRLFPRLVPGLALFVAAALSLLAPRPGLAFDVDRSATGAIVRFPHLPVSVYWRPQAVGKLSAAQVEGAIQAAIATWNAVPQAKVALIFGGRVTKSPLFDVFIAFDSSYDLGQGDPTGSATAIHSSDGRVSRVEIRLNANPNLTFPVLWTLNPSQLSGDGLVADLQGALTHQLGHAIGLGHSRDSASVMYFFRTDTGQRTLSEDDRRGARFLWPASPIVPASRQCDACASDTDCAEGRCFAWADGSRHCLRSCNVQGDCPLTTSCGSTGDGKACLPNDRHCHAQSGQADPGGLCFSDAACPSRHFCSTEGKFGWCTAGCDGDSDCSGGLCTQVGAGRLCVFPGTHPLGGNCLIPSACATASGQIAACAPSLAYGGQCSLSCAASGGCPSGFSCGSDGFCAPIGGPLPLGFPCESGFDCATGQCVASPGGRFARACASECTVASDCPAGTGCSKVGGSSWCLPFGAVLPGSACLLSGSCGGNLVCDEGPTAAVGACASPCDPFATSSGCSSQESCVWVGAASSLGGVCRAGVSGGGPGDACSASSPCRPDLDCSGAAGDPSTCHAPCDLAAKGGCVGSLVCAALQHGEQPSGHGVCAAAVSPQIGAAVQAAPIDNFAAITGLSLPDVVLASHFKGVVPPGSTCSASRHGRWSLMGLLVIALASVVLVRRRA
jgi:predicted Zn-dependent protease